MIFNSATFLLFFIVFYQIYWLLNNKASVNVRNAFTIIGSYVFYAWWDWRFLSLIVFSSIVDFLIGTALAKINRTKYRRLLLIFSLTANLGILGFFKYYNFFVDSLRDLLEVFTIQINTSTLSIILPIGISFYTFQTLSYTIDIYRHKIKPTRNILSFFAFVSFFPQLVAGPIERAGHLLGQFQEKKTFQYQQAVAGLRLALWGFFKKIVIADNFGYLADQVFNTENPVSGHLTLAGALFFALQIYADFSGYSDIAIGISRMLGFDLMKNFKTPYFSKSFTEFWHRWHISLSTWFRDYLYIPLGGSRKSNSRIYLNIMITFLLSGLWHGANITFLIWGGLHGLLLVLEKAWKKRARLAFYQGIVIFLVVLFWIPFRAESFHHLTVLAQSLINIQSYGYASLVGIIESYSLTRFVVLGGITLLFLIMESKFSGRDFHEWIDGKKQWLRIVSYYIVVLLILFLGNFSVKPDFIYFQF